MAAKLLASLQVALIHTAVSLPTLGSKMRGATMGALVADALTLGTHYEYDATKIKRFYGEIDRYYAPGEKTGGETHGVGWGARNFHGGNGVGPPKAAGENTDYGDYVLLILEHLAETADEPHRIDLAELVPRWQTSLRTWRSWICTQTKQTYQQVSQGVPHTGLGGSSNAMALRAPAALSYYSTEEDVVHAARTAMFTHREQTAHEGAEFFARVAFRVVNGGLAPSDAIAEVAATSSSFVAGKVAQATQKAAEAMDAGSALAAEEFADDLALTSMARLWEIGKSEPIKVGKASPTEGTLPGSVYFILKYENDFAAAAQANAAVGGDNASRAVAIGMILGAFHGIEGIPDRLRGPQLVEWDRAQSLLSRLPLLRASSRAEL